MRFGWVGVAVGLVAPSCGAPDGAAPVPTRELPPVSSAPAPSQTVATTDPDTIEASFVGDTPDHTAGTEAFVCYVFDAPGAGGALVGSIRWKPPSGDVALHHASLFAARDELPVGEVPCDSMPERVAALGVYTHGSAPLTFPENTAVVFAPQTQRLVVLAHVLRTGMGPAEPTRIELGRVTHAEHALNWLDVPAPTPTLTPHRTESSVGVCVFVKPAHIVTVWPHMHRHGTSFLGLIVRGDGHADTLIDVPTWDYEHQPTYRVDADVQVGDSVETICNWNNPTDQDVEPGPLIANEMCNQGLFVWPFDAALCANP